MNKSDTLKLLSVVMEIISKGLNEDESEILYELQDFLINKIKQWN